MIDSASQGFLYSTKVTLQQTHMGQFYKSMFQFFETDLGQDLVLFNNKEILIDHKTPFFYKSWFKKGIFRVQDLFMESGT